MRKYNVIAFINASSVKGKNAAEVHRFPLFESLAKQLALSGGRLLVVAMPRLSFGFKPGLFTKLADNLFALSPAIPGKYSLAARNGLARRFFLKRLGAQLSQACQRFGFSADAANVLWLSHPFHKVVVELFDDPLIVYDAYDDYSLFGKKSRDQLLYLNEIDFASRVDVVLAGSESRKNDLLRHNKNTYVFNSAINGLAYYDVIAAEYEEFKLIGRPIIGFCGCLKPSDDLALIRDLASNRTDWSFVFVGEVARPAKKEYESLRCLPNVHNCLGFKPQHDLARYIRAFDVAIMPFKVNELTNTFTPHKMYDYIGAGVPIVSTPIKEVLRFRDVIEIASDSEQFEAAIRRSLKKDRNLLQRSYQQIFGKDTWDNRAAFVSGLIQELLENKVANIVN